MPWKPCVWITKHNISNGIQVYHLKKIVLKKIAHFNNGNTETVYIKPIGSVRTWAWYNGWNTPNTLWFNHREDDVDRMSFDFHYTSNGPMRPFYFWTPTHRMKAIPNTFSQNFHGAMHADTAVMGWMPNIEI
jgi:hypothetical protein